MILKKCPISILATGLLSCAVASAAEDTAVRRAAQRLSLTPCKFEWIDQEVLCGSIEVFENRTTQAGRKIPINVVVVPSLVDNPTETPLFYFEGGPGVPSTDAASVFVEDSLYRENRDIVLIDMRGTGLSNPLHCNLRGDPFDLQNYLNEMYPDSAVIACRRELEKIADLTQYTTPFAIEDFEDVRRWLGYDTINLMGLSYGTRLAQTYIRMHPEHIRCAVLIGPLPPSVRLPSDHAPAAQRAIKLVLSDCADDSACRNAFPHLNQDLEDVWKALNAKPAQVSIPHPISGKSVTLEIRRDIFFESLRNKLYSINGARKIPWIVTRAAQGDFGPFLDGAIPKTLDEPPFLSEGLYLSVTCSEDIPFIDTAKARMEYEGTYFGGYRVRQQCNAARLWPRGGLPEGYLGSFTSFVPTLIISGFRDPITPPSYAEEIVHTLPRGRVVSVPAMAHIPYGMTHSDCLFNLINRFIEAGNADSLDESCIETMEAPPFRLSGN